MKEYEHHYLPFPAPFQLTAKTWSLSSRQTTVLQKMSLATKKVMFKVARGTML